MNPLSLPIFCKRDAFAFLKKNRDSKSSRPLVEGTCAIAMQFMEEVDLQQCQSILDGYARRVSDRVRSKSQHALLAHLHQVLFDEEGFLGNNVDYYSPSNSYLPAVLKSKRGLPIILSLIYTSVASQIGLSAWGVGLPGHFVVAVEQDGAQNPMIVDPFSGGRILTISETHERMKEVVGPEVEWSDTILEPTSNRHWLTRILQNLLHAFGTENKYQEMAPVLEFKIALWPDQLPLWRDLGLILARAGRLKQAAQCLAHYLLHDPDDPQKEDLERLLETLKK